MAKTQNSEIENKLKNILNDSDVQDLNFPSCPTIDPGSCDIENCNRECPKVTVSVLKTHYTYRDKISLYKNTH